MTLLEKFQRTKQLFPYRHAVHEAGASIVRVSNLSVWYENTPALEQVSFELKGGERVAIVGPNGAGKSTLFKVIAGVQRPTQGEVEVFGHLPGGHICIAYVPQRSQVDWSFPVSVADVVMMGRIGRLGLFRWPAASDWKKVNQALEVVGLGAMAGRQISQLSGGQQQRMFIARALAQEAELMLMDEPLTGLDVNSQRDILNILAELSRRSVTVLVALHDLKLAAERFDRVLLLNRHLVGIGTPEEVLTQQNLLDGYGAHIRFLPTDNGVMAVEDSCCDEGD